MMTDCPECGKHHVVTWPEMSPFRRGDLFYCCHECWETSVRRDLKKIKDVARKRRKGSIRMSVKITEAVKARAVEIAISGESPLPYLKQAGAANPSACWQYIKKQLEKRDPEKYAALPGKLPKAGAKDVPAPIGGGDWEKAEVPEPVATVKVDGPLKIETPEAGKVQVVEKPEKDFPPITAPVAYDGMLVREVEGLFGRYRHSAVGSAVYIDFESADRLDTLSYTIDQWRMFRAEQEKAARILGVEL